MFGADSDSDSLSSLSPFPEGLRSSSGRIVKRRRWPELEREPVAAVVNPAVAAAAAVPQSKPPQSKPVPLAPLHQKPLQRQPMHRRPGKPRGPNRQRTASASSSSDRSSLSELSNFSDTHPVSTRLAKQLKPGESTRKSARQQERTSRRTGRNGSGSSSESSHTEGKPTSGELSSSGNLESSRSKRVPRAREVSPSTSALSTDDERLASKLQSPAPSRRGGLVGSGLRGRARRLFNPDGTPIRWIPAGSTQQPLFTSPSKAPSSDSATELTCQPSLTLYPIPVSAVMIIFV